MHRCQQTNLTQACQFTKRYFMKALIRISLTARKYKELGLQVTVDLGRRVVPYFKMAFFRMLRQHYEVCIGVLLYCNAFSYNIIKHLNFCQTSFCQQLMLKLAALYCTLTLLQCSLNYFMLRRKKVASVYKTIILYNARLLLHHGPHGLF